MGRGGAAPASLPSQALVGAPGESHDPKGTREDGDIGSLPLPWPADRVQGVGCCPRDRVRGGSFGPISLVIGWFQGVEGVAGPVTELGYGALVGIILTMGLLVQLHAPEGKIAGLSRPPS